MRPEIRLSAFSVDDLRNYSELSSRIYGDKASVCDLTHIAWKHIDNPSGPSEMVGLYDEDKIVGRAMLQRRTIQVGNSSYSAAFVADVLIEEGYRRPLTNFSKLMKKALYQSNIDLVLHTANEVSESLYLKLMRFEPVFSLQSFVVPIQPAALLTRFISLPVFVSKAIDWVYIKLVLSFAFVVMSLARVKLTSCEASSFVFSSERGSPHLVKDEAFLKWRLDCPLLDAECVSLEVNDIQRNRILIGKSEFEGIEALVLMECSRGSNCGLLLRFAQRLAIVRFAILSNMKLIYYITNPNSDGELFTGFPFIKVPDRFLPHATPIFIHTNTEELEGLNFSNLAISLADLDYF